MPLLILRISGSCKQMTVLAPLHCVGVVMVRKLLPLLPQPKLVRLVHGARDQQSRIAPPADPQEAVSPFLTATDLVELLASQTGKELPGVTLLSLHSRSVFTLCIMRLPAPCTDLHLISRHMQ